MLNSAGGGEAPDRRVEGVMSRPAGEALPQRPRPAPPRPHRWCCCPGCWTLGVGGPLSGEPRTRPARSPAVPASLTQWTDSLELQGPQVLKEGRSAGWPWLHPAPRPTPGLPLPP